MTDSTSDNGVRQAKSALLTSPRTIDPPFALVRVRSADEELAVMAREVRDGLAADLPSLPSKYFYDARGSALFERITTLPEYYPTRVEEGIHRRVAAEVVERARPREWVEVGAGTGAKTRRVLDHIAARDEGLRSCVLLDVDEAALRASL